VMAGADVFGKVPGRLGHQNLGNGRSHIDVYSGYGIDCSKQGSLGRVYRRANKTATLSLSFINWSRDFTPQLQPRLPWPPTKK